MNERIRELYRQAHGTRHYDGDPALDGNPPTVYWQGEVSAERFARLIVKKCAELSRSHQDFPETEQTIRRWVAEDIERHFGVE